MFPVIDQQEVWEAMFALCWTQHGGSGLGWTRSEVLDMTIAEFRWFIERVSSQRAKEANALRKAYRGRK